MKVLKQYVGETEWFEITLEEAIESCEGRGYYKKGSVKNILKEGATIRTPWSFFKHLKSDTKEVA